MKKSDVKLNRLPLHKQKFWLLKIGGEVETEIKIEVIEVKASTEANQSLSEKPLSATIVARKVIFRNFVIS